MTTRITEKILLDHYKGITNGLDIISDFNGTEIIWTYRQGKDTNGYNVATHNRNNATEITIERDNCRPIALDDDCDDHQAIADIKTALEKVRL